jgi:hypothetical protein
MDLSVSQFVVEAPILLMVTIGSFSIALLLKSGKVLLNQTLLFAAMIPMTSASAALTLLGIIQILLVAFILYRLFKAVSYNYQLIEEKTHLIPHQITKNNKNGGRKTFL